MNTDSKDYFGFVINKNAFTEEEIKREIENGIIAENAISWTAENGYLDLTEKLIEAGADIKENRNYPLELASRNGHTQIVKRLLEAGASPLDGDDKDYCLRLASYNGNIEIVNMLLDAGSDPTLGDYYALMLALNSAHMDVVEVLLDAIYKRRNGKKETIKKHVKVDK